MSRDVVDRLLRDSEKGGFDRSCSRGQRHLRSRKVDAFEQSRCSPGDGWSQPQVVK
jgi:hypothetical protein